MKGLHRPFNNERTVGGFVSLTEKLKVDFSTYDMLVGDDVSGRLPTLLFANLLRRKRSQLGLHAPKIYFVNAGANLTFPEYSHETLQELSKLINKNNPGNSKILFVTEHICTGTSVMTFLKELEKHGLTADVAALSLTTDRSVYSIPTKLYFGEIGGAGSNFYLNPSLAGVDSSKASAVSERFEKSKYRPSTLTAREDMKLLANYLWRIIE